MRLLDLMLGRSEPESSRRIGLVLGGGAMRGAAHLGVLQVFEEEGIRPDLIVGVSAGSVVGALYCAGLTPIELQEVCRGMSWTRLARLTRPGLGLFDISGLEQVIDDLLGGITFEELTIAFAAVAVDILTDELVIFRHGRLARAIRASCSVPGLFTPV